MSGEIQAQPQEHVDRAGRKIVRDVDGVPLCINDLPAAGCRWNKFRKARVLIAIDGGIIQKDVAIARYGLSEEELASWRTALNLEGVDGLKATRGRW